MIDAFAYLCTIILMCACVLVISYYKYVKYIYKWYTQAIKKGYHI